MVLLLFISFCFSHLIHRIWLGFAIFFLMRYFSYCIYQQIDQNDQQNVCAKKSAHVIENVSCQFSLLIFFSVYLCSFSASSNRHLIHICRLAYFYCIEWKQPRKRINCYIDICDANIYRKPPKGFNYSSWRIYFCWLRTNVHAAQNSIDRFNGIGWFCHSFSLNDMNHFAKLMLVSEISCKLSCKTVKAIFDEAIFKRSSCYFK